MIEAKLLGSQTLYKLLSAMYAGGDDEQIENLDQRRHGSPGSALESVTLT